MSEISRRPLNENPNRPLTDMMKDVVDAHIPREGLGPGEIVHKDFPIPTEIGGPRESQGWTLARLARERIDKPIADGTKDVYMIAAGPSEREPWVSKYTEQPVAVARTGEDRTPYLVDGRLTKKGELKEDELSKTELRAMDQAKRKQGAFPLPENNTFLIGLRHIGRLIENNLISEADYDSDLRIGLNGVNIQESVQITEPLPPTTPLYEAVQIEAPPEETE